MARLAPSRLLPQRHRDASAAPISIDTTLTRLIYQLILWLASPAVLSYTLNRALRNGGKRYLQQRLGWGVPRLGQPIWFHCASVGEVVAIRPLIELIVEKHPQFELVVTTNTPTGADVLMKSFGQRVIHSFLPLDYAGPIKRFLRRAEPRCAVMVETELWPMLFAQCHRRSIPLLIVNGRLSERTLGAPAFVRHLYRHTLSQTTAILTRSEADTRHFEMLGAPPDRLITVGNLKFAQHTNSPHAEHSEPVGRLYWLAASTHHDEEMQLARLLARLGNHGRVLVIAPRHPDRAQAIHKALTAQAWSVAVRSRNDPITPATQIYLADTLGEMELFMSHADFVFLGGSLVPRGGHNILEPARLGKAVIVGPHMENFEMETRSLLSAGGLLKASNAPDFLRKLQDLLEDPRLRQTLGNRAKTFIDQHADIHRQYLQHLGSFCRLSARPSLH